LENPQLGIRAVQLPPHPPKAKEKKGEDQ